MDLNETNIYSQQLIQVNQALTNCPEGTEKEELLILKANIEELLSLTNGHEKPSTPSSSKDPLSDEFALFMIKKDKENNEAQNLEELKDIEGMKCRAPHKHQWGHIAYHNAMICSVVPDSTDSYETKVRVLFTNPTHQEMLPCPYYYDTDCKFSDEKCRFSHGEVVLYSSLQEYIEPKFNLLTTGSSVLAKQSNNLWYRAIIKKIYGEKCLVSNDENEQNEYKSSEDDEEKCEGDGDEDIINMSLMITPSNQILGDWEKYTKGIGSKLMQKMGYIVGTGLGRNAEGRIDPITAVILPSGKSLDYCMTLREQAGGDKNLFSKAYERKSKEVNVFNFINETLSDGNKSETKDRIDERQKIKKESSRSLNIRSLQIADNIRKSERDLEKLRDSLARHTDTASNIHLKLKDKLMYRQDQLKMYQTQASMIRNEQSLRNDKKKMTIF
ncbi:hypothetical protein NQ314_009042 [Rhamnusium bicolor]|uniref:Zinc finger CCCH-type with G patch domain-containing protein n=1 Tax=Rhamnusium bicolor TaxID=1586634 RepID=A0AAV8Y372_9CUCU|nr:hypothetical protein NQ314_009042 [Rhamnusium bicolor]